MAQDGRQDRAVAATRPGTAGCSSAAATRPGLGVRPPGPRREGWRSRSRTADPVPGCQGSQPAPWRDRAQASAPARPRSPRRGPERGPLGRGPRAPQRPIRPRPPARAAPGPSGQRRKRRPARPERKRRPERSPAPPAAHLEVVAAEVHAAHERQHPRGLHGAALPAAPGGARGGGGSRGLGRRRPRPFTRPRGGRKGGAAAAPSGPRAPGRVSPRPRESLGLPGPQFPVC